MRINGSVADGVLLSATPIPSAGFDLMVIGQRYWISDDIDKV